MENQAASGSPEMSGRTVQLKKQRHPGSGQGRANARPKGRAVESGALEDIRALLGSAPRRRDLLIEHLHLIQDRYGCLSARHLAALADEMRLAMTEVYEVATFYAHFDVVLEGETPPPAVTVRVCDSLSCQMAGAQGLLANLAANLDGDVRVVRAPCMGACDKAPVVAVGHAQVYHASPDSVAAVVAIPGTGHELPEYRDMDAYLADGGYTLLRQCLDGGRPVDDLIATLGDSGLKGLGGAGFPTGRKWSIVRSFPGPRLMALNADEGEPGTFKDRYFLERDPHRVIEGMLIASWAVEADGAYVYLRDEYPAIRDLLLAELAKVEAAGLTRRTQVHLRRGAGAYICGEESAMIESIEGKRGLPRHRPPYVAEEGLFGRPTLVQNVETMYWVRDIVEKGPKWFADQGRDGHPGIRTFSVSGRVREPGVKMVPAGITAQDLIDEHCGGMADGHTFKGYLPGGASGGILPASMADIPLDFGTLDKYGCFVGSHAVMVFSDKDDIRDVAVNVLRFFEDESCGQCTPCRVGCEKAVTLMETGQWDQSLLRELGDAMRDASICGLGQAAPNPLFSVLDRFAEDLR
jgi:formate dehydrogenase